MEEYPLEEFDGVIAVHPSRGVFAEQAGVAGNVRAWVGSHPEYLEPVGEIRVWLGLGIRDSQKLEYWGSHA